MNNFRRSIQEIVQVVKIADCTVRKRVEEFKQTGSAGLSVGDFRNVWLEEEGMPPAFVRGREKEEKVREEQEGVVVDEEDEPSGSRRRKGKGKKRKRTWDEKESGYAPEASQATIVGTQPRIPIDPALFEMGILEGTSSSQGREPSQPQPLFLPEDPPDASPPFASSSLPVASSSTLPPNLPLTQQPFSSPSSTLVPTTQPIPKDSFTAGGEVGSEEEDVDTTLDNAIAEEVSSYLDTAQSTSQLPANALTEAPKDIPPDEALEGLDEEELDAFLLTEDEVRDKERVWVEMNREYLENLAAKAEMEQSGEQSEKKKRKVAFQRSSPSSSFWLTL